MQITSAPDGTAKTCFLIDDDDDDLELFIMALREVNKPLTCLTAKNATAALHMLKDNAVLPDYFFIDLNMPMMNGKQLLAEIKKDPRLRNVPVIIYSTSSDHRDKADTLALGASDFITKPTSQARLVKLLNDFFTKYQT